MDQLSHKCGIRTTEFINILVIVSHSNHTHIVIVTYQRLNQRKFICVHILCLVNYKNAFGNPPLLHLAVCNHLRRIVHHVFHAVQTADLTQQIKTIRMKGLDLHKICRISDQSHQTLFEFGCRRP